MKIAVTGHRPNKLGGEYDLKGPYSNHIRNELQKVINDLHPDTMISGMALGVDTIWAELALNNNIPLIACIPFEGQEAKWAYEQRLKYRFILSHLSVKKIIVGTPGYEPWKMEVRNEYMVKLLTDPDDLLVAVYNGDLSGGTFNCVRYAESIHKNILKINPNPQTNENISQGYIPDPEEQRKLWSDLNDELFK